MRVKGRHVSSQVVSGPCEVPSDKFVEFLAARHLRSTCRRVEENIRGVQEKNSEIHKQHPNGNCLPLLGGQSFQRQPPGPRYMFFSELPNEGPRYVPSQQKPTVGANHHTLLTPREHNVRPSLVLHEPRRRGSDYRDDDVVLFASLKGVDVEYGVFPCEAGGFQGILDRAPLGVVGSDDFEVFLFLDVTTGYLHHGFDLFFVLSGRIGVSHTYDGFVFWRIDAPPN